jgi:methylated-DNA-[protein]-cysteine S-methyltransferase
MRLMSMRHGVVASPVGALTVVAHDGGLAGLYFADHLRRPGPDAFGPRDDAPFAEVARQLDEYFGGARTGFDLPLAAPGTAFHQRVWDLVARIPYGRTRTYGELAKELGDPGLAQAVGAANGRNPLSILVPCHRVVGADGNLTGYAGGLARKRFLLDLEARADAPAGRLF